MAKSAHIYDVLVVGAGVSGATAAALLCEEGRDVLLLESVKSANSLEQCDWIGPEAGPILKQAAVATESIFSHPVLDCTLYSADLSKSIKPALPKTPAYLVDYHQLAQLIREKLVMADCGRFIDGAEVVNVHPREDVVTATLANGTQHVGKLLVIATGHRTELLDQVGLPMAADGGLGLWYVSYQCPAGDFGQAGHIDYVLGIDGGAGFAHRSCRDSVISVELCSPQSAETAKRELARVSRRYSELGLLDPNWESFADSATPQWSSAGVSLEIESHVAKRTLIIGQAGGFVTGYTNEGIYPGMWSAQLACEIIGRTLKSSQPQDTLREFESLWRTTMAQHLRAPHEDAQSILPLVLSNQRMADKMLESLHLGLNF